MSQYTRLNYYNNEYIKLKQSLLGNYVISSTFIITIQSNLILLNSRSIYNTAFKPQHYLSTLYLSNLYQSTLSLSILYLPILYLSILSLSILYLSILYLSILYLSILYSSTLYHLLIEYLMRKERKWVKIFETGFSIGRNWDLMLLRLITLFFRLIYRKVRERSCSKSDYWVGRSLHRERKWSC